MTDKKASYYMVIPATVWDAKIPANAKLCYGHITVLANKEGYCFATNTYLGKQLGVAKETASTYVSKLQELGVISTQIILKPDSKEVKERRIYITEGLIGINKNINRPINKKDNGPINQKIKGNTTSNNNTSNNNIDEVKGKVFFKIVDLYPKNRVGNRQHGLKKFKKLDTEECKLALKNLDRYLKVAGGYVKSLQNYIDEECFSEEWLSAEERNKSQKGGTTDNVAHNAAVFKNRDLGFYDNE